MGKPRMIILIRHAQSEGNKNREIHQSVPDHRVKLTQEGWKQAEEAGVKLRSILNPDDTLHFFTSPYRRTRETTEGILSSLTSDDPSPSPFPRHTIKVYEEPRLREQDFGNFQPNSAEMERMWQERADYGHFFYRIPNGESAADAYDRISGFNESLWRQFGEDDFASVAVIVTHGLMTRVFLMKWYHFSVEYFEDLRNVNHCEFVIMKKNENGKYLLENHLRTWSELRKEREEHAQSLLHKTNSTLTIPERKRWGGCRGSHNRGNSRPRIEQDSASDNINDSNPESGAIEETFTGEHHNAENSSGKQTRSAGHKGLHQRLEDFLSTSPKSKFSHRDNQEQSYVRSADRISVLRGGRDGGGSMSGANSQAGSSDEDDSEDHPVEHEVKAQDPSPKTIEKSRLRARADALGDQSDTDPDEDETDETIRALSSSDPDHNSTGI